MHIFFGNHGVTTTDHVLYEFQAYMARDLQSIHSSPIIIESEIQRVIM